MDEFEGGHGKAQRSRRHQQSRPARGPYARPPPAAAPEPEHPIEALLQQPAAAAPVQRTSSLLGSMFAGPFRAAATLMHRVRGREDRCPHHRPGFSPAAPAG